MTEPTPAAADSDDALLRLAAAVRATGYSFTTVTPATHARVDARPGNAWARDLAGVLGWSRPFRPEILPPGLFDLMRRAGVAVPHGTLEGAPGRRALSAGAPWPSCSARRCHP